ncbi:hypothetical protein Tco_1110249 [Tanacetum coccineum]|uniref:Reverse transcriptase Ty1/copia-type domain-containing protein n=1 Tax=Tanacetum coccineum TaxID=301880 RepID=A0ABQ5IIP4_9ASTR
MDPRRTKKHFQSEKEAISCFLTAVSTGSYDIRAERIAKSANPLALIAAAQPYSDNYYQAPKPQRSHATSSSTRPSASTRHKGKEIAKTNKPSNLITLQLHGHKIQEVSPEESCSTGLVLHQMTSDHNRSELGIQDHSNEPSSSKLVPKVVPLAVKTATSRQELELLFHHHIAMLRTTGQTVVTATKSHFKCSIYEETIRKLRFKEKTSLTSDLKLPSEAGASKAPFKIMQKSMIGSLMYLTASRPDIMFVVCACARDSTFELEAFSDSDYGGAILDRKSTTGGCQFLGRRLISCQCKKQTIVANSTTETEYVVAANYYLLIKGFDVTRFNFLVVSIRLESVATIEGRQYDLESLERDIDGTEELLLPDWLILWLTKVCTNSAKLVPKGKDSTAIKPLKKIPPMV